MIPADADPLIAARRRTQVIAAPVVDHVLAVAELGRKPVTLVPLAARLVGPARRYVFNAAGPFAHVVLAVTIRMAIAMPMPVVVLLRAG